MMTVQSMAKWRGPPFNLTSMGESYFTSPTRQAPLSINGRPVVSIFPITGRVPKREPQPRTLLQPGIEPMTVGYLWMVCERPNGLDMATAPPLTQSMPPSPQLFSQKSFYNEFCVPVPLLNTIITTSISHIMSTLEVWQLKANVKDYQNYIFIFMKYF